MTKSGRITVGFIAALMCFGYLNGVCFAFDDEDFQYWSTAKFSFDLDKDWGFTFAEEFKLSDDAGRLYYHHSDLGLVYKALADWIDLGANYRKAFEKDSKGEWRQENRPHLNITLKGRLLGLGVSNRSRFEYRDRENKKDLWRYRNKFTVKFPVQFRQLKCRLYVADEVFINFDSEDFNKNRLYSGISFDLSKNIKGDIFYMRQSSKSGGSWNDINVLGTALKFYF